MGFQASSTRESVIVVIDANRNRGNLAALNWALENVVRPKDTVLVLGILCEVGKRSSCFPLYICKMIFLLCISMVSYSSSFYLNWQNNNHHHHLSFSFSVILIL